MRRAYPLSAAARAAIAADTRQGFLVGTAKPRQRTTYEYGRVWLTVEDAVRHAITTLKDMDGEATASVVSTAGPGRYPGAQVASWIKLRSGTVVTLRNPFRDGSPAAP